MMKLTMQRLFMRAILQGAIIVGMIALGLGSLVAAAGFIVPRPHVSTTSFSIDLNLPTFGGRVYATIHTTGLEGCERLRDTIISQFGVNRKTGGSNVNGTVTECEPS